MKLRYLAEELMPNIQTIGYSFNSSKWVQWEYSRNPRIARTIYWILTWSHNGIPINKTQEKFLEDLLSAIQKWKDIEFEKKYWISYNIALDIIIRMWHNHIFLYGPPGVGKTTLWKELAKKLWTNPIDTDERMEQENKGKTIADIITVGWIDRFRQIEFDILSKVLMEARERHVISLWWWTLLDPKNLNAVQLHGTIVLLTADIKTLTERVLIHPNQRPLIDTSNTTGAHNSLDSLIRQRAEHYWQFQHRIDSSTGQPESTIPKIIEMVW